MASTEFLRHRVVKILVLVAPLAVEAPARASQVDSQQTTKQDTDVLPFPEFLRERIRKARELGNAGDLEAAIAAIADTTSRAELPSLKSEGAQALAELADFAYRLGAVQVASDAWSLLSEWREENLGPHAAGTLAAKQNAGSLLSALGQSREAIELLNAALLGFEETLAEGDPQLAGARINLGGALKAAERYDEALAQFGQAIASLVGTVDESHPYLRSARLNQAICLFSMGEIDESTRLLEAQIMGMQESVAETDGVLVRARQIYALCLHEAGRTDEALELERRLLDTQLAALPEHHPDVQLARRNLANSLRFLHQPEESIEIQRRLIESLVATHPAGHQQINDARLNLAATLSESGAFEEARQLETQVCIELEQRLPSDDPSLLEAQRNLSLTLNWLGEHEEALALQRSVLEAWGSRVAPSHAKHLRAREDLVVTLLDMGRPDEAREQLEQSLAIREPRDGRHHPETLDILQNLARAMLDMGAIDESLELSEEVLRARVRSVPEEDLDLRVARINLAATLELLGQHARARVLEEKVLAVCERTLADDHPDLQLARVNLANTLSELGDNTGARALLEQAVSELRTRYGDSHPSTLIASSNLAGALHRLGLDEEARDVRQRILDARLEKLPVSHVDVQLTRINLGSSHWRLGEYEKAAKLHRAALRHLEARFPDGHPLTETARSGLATCLASLGDHEGSGALYTRALEQALVFRPHDHPELQSMRVNLVWSLAALGEQEALIEQIRDLCAALHSRMERAHLMSVRERREYASDAESVVSCVASLVFELESSDSPERAAAAADLAEEIFAVAETLRAFSMVRDTKAKGPELARESFLLRRRVHDVATRAEADGDSGALEFELAQAVRERDAFERRTLESDPSGLRAPSVDVASVARTLAADEIAIAYRRIIRVRIDPTSASEPWLLAHVVLPSGELRRVSLGAEGGIEELVRAWRASMGAVDAGGGTRGLGVVEAAQTAGAAKGTALREAVLDPLLACAPDARKLRVCVDGAVHLVPLDALPLGNSLVGDAFEIDHVFSLAPIPAPKALAADLVAIGGVDFSAEPSGVQASGQALTEVSLGKNASRKFEPLPGTRAELDGLFALYRRHAEREGIRIGGAEATKATIASAAGKARYLHVATHGYFAADGYWDANALHHSVIAPASARVGLAPMTLCGLVLSGANSGRSSCFLSGEEIAGLDLAGCELAVLSACDTHVGIRRAGQGVASLQQALFIAGASNVVTSLWKVSDHATRELMLEFYRSWWEGGKTRAAALWAAKTRLRRSRDANGQPRYSARDWAGWVLTGEPD